MKKTTLFLSGLTAAALLSGCNSSSTTSVATTATDTETTHDIGYFVDSAVANVNYDCLEDNTTGITDEDGAFSCTHMKKIRFRIGQAILGEIETLPEDGYVFPQDLVNVDREAGLNDKNVTAMVQLLQALDSDNNASNGIEIPEDTKEILTETTTITPDTVVEIANQTDVSLVEKENAIAHLQETMQRLHATKQNTTQQRQPQEQEATHPTNGRPHTLPTIQDPKEGQEEIVQTLPEENTTQTPQERNSTNAEVLQEEIDHNTPHRQPVANPEEEERQQEPHTPTYGTPKEQNATQAPHNQEIQNREEEPKRAHDHNTTATPETTTPTEEMPTEKTPTQESPETQTASSLTPELQEALAHMGNEERLAYDVYSNLYSYHMNNGIEITQLNNISKNSEIKHIDKVQTLVREYGLDAKKIEVVDANVVETHNLGSDVTQEKMPSGVYDIQAIQNLYDELYAKGQESQQAALEVGCMVEVVDVEDLTKYIEMAQESNASDIEKTFDQLRSASYNHYHSFDNALKKIGVEDGCCSLGETWCQDYPDNRGKGHKHN